MDRKGGRAAWICCNGFHLVVGVKLIADYNTSDDGNILYCKFNVFLNMDIGNSQAGQPQKRR